MSDLVDAIYENGQFRPLAPVALPEHELVRLSIVRLPESPDAHTNNDAAVLAQQQDALDRLRSAVKSLPCPPNLDGFSNRDHDSVLYGWKK